MLNVNVGILGHVDSGKTSLAKLLSSEASTAAFDKSPQSQQRGITLDLGFSAFTVHTDDAVSGFPDVHDVQFTLVDCPGHASLIKTIIGGSQIMDTMLLVVDVNKGFQTQTAEGLVVGMLTTNKLVVALNKIDMLPAAGRAEAVEKASQRIRKVLASTPFSGAQIVPVAACAVGRPGTIFTDEERASFVAGIDGLKRALLRTVDSSIAERRAQGSSAPFCMAVDHCFSVKGQGTVVTGTVLRGTVTVGSSVEACETGSVHKVKSIQVFHKPVERASVGDRIGMCLLGLDAKAFERGVVAEPASIPVAGAFVGLATKISYFKHPCLSKSKFHITIGHSTVLATVHFCRRASATDADKSKWDGDAEYEYLEQLPAADEAGGDSTWVIVEFEQPAPCPSGALFIASHLDADKFKNACRLAFHGHVALCYPTVDALHSSLRMYTLRSKEGVVERAVDPRTAIAKGLFKKEANFELYVGLKVTVPGYISPQATTDTPVLTAKIDSAFGKSGKFKIIFDRDVTAKGITGQKIVLTYKKYRFAKHTKLFQ